MAIRGVMDSNKKRRIIIIAISVLIIAIISIGTVAILKSVNKTETQTTSKTTKATADKLKAQALKAVEDDDKTKAKTLFEKAKAEYSALKDTNNVIDMEAQIYILEHNS